MSDLVLNDSRGIGHAVKEEKEDDWVLGKDSFLDHISFPFLDDDEKNTPLHSIAASTNSHCNKHNSHWDTKVVTLSAIDPARCSMSSIAAVQDICCNSPENGNENSTTTTTITRARNQKSGYVPSYIPSYKKSKLDSNTFVTSSSLASLSHDQGQDTDAMMNLFFQVPTPNEYGRPSDGCHNAGECIPSQEVQAAKISSSIPNKESIPGERNGFFSFMSGSISPNPSPMGISHNNKRYPNASPVPSLASSEYSMVSPCPEEDRFLATPGTYFLESPSMLYERSSSVQEDVFSTPLGGYETDYDNVSNGQIKADSCFMPTYKCPPTPSAVRDPYYFTPVQPYSSEYGTLRADGCEDPVSRSRHHGHEALPQCMPVSSDAQRPTTHSLQRDSYLSTAMRGNETSKIRVNSQGSSSFVTMSVSNQSPITHRAKSNAAESSPNSSSPLPQNLKGDPLRQAKVKTELCLFFSRGKMCPFGSKCNYAHGEDELKYTKLMELERAGLVHDIRSYRAYPCFSWVSTGACPFGLRCTNIHDPRVAGMQSSWLPHCDIPVANLPTDLVVDKSHHRNIAMMSQKNPIVQNLLWNERPSLKKKIADGEAYCVTEKDDMEWRDTYSLVCNLANLNPSKIPRTNIVAKTKISELQRLCIAIDMNYGSRQSIDYVYKPKHLIYNELCMVVRTKYYALLNPQHIAGMLNIEECPPIHLFVKEISKRDYDLAKTFCNDGAAYKSDQVIVVQELAFGCVGEPMSRVSLWYDLVEMTELTPQEVKRIKRNRQRNKDLNSEGSKIISCYPGSESSFANAWVERSSLMRARTATSFDTHPHKPFFRVEPVTKTADAFNLVRDVLHHRISVLVHREYRAYSATESAIRETIIAQDVQLEKIYQSIKNDTDVWQWPVSKGREVITEETKVPKTLIEYKPASPSQVTPIWDGFLTSLDQPSNSLETKPSEGTKSSLPIFKKLADCETVGRFKGLTHIKAHARNDAGCNFMEKFLGDWNIISSHYSESNNSLPMSASA